MLRKITSLFLSAILTLSLILVLFGVSTMHLLNPEVYQEALQETSAYDALEQEFVQTLMVPVPMQGLIGEVLLETLNYIKGDSDELTGMDQQIKEAMLIELAALPECNQEHTQAEDQITCLPPGTTVEELAEQLNNEESSIAEQKRLLDKARTAYTIAELVFTTAIITGLLAILLLLFINRKNVKEGVKWIESDVIFVGGSLVITGYVLSTKILEYLPEINETIADTLYYILNTVFQAMILWGSVLLGIGVVLFIVLLIKPRKKEFHELPVYENQTKK